ncbi:MAG TPA: hypothetical protein VLM89_08635 [Phycisphaerae bacterium]|nr:hypothetical protein [Phycisphaerae bacterium]
MPTTRHHRLIYFLALAALGCPLFLPANCTYYGEQPYPMRLVVLAPWVREVAWCVTVAAIPCFLALMILAAWHRRNLGVAASLGAVFLLLPIECGYVLYRDSGAWTVEDKVLASDGRTYLLLDSSTLDRQAMAIGRLRTRNLFYKDIEVLGTARIAEKGSWAAIIAPAGKGDLQYRELYLSPSGLLLGLRHGRQCLLAFDVNRQRFIGPGEIEHLSPFALLDHDTAPSQSDLHQVMEHMRSIRPPAPGYPHRDQIEAGLQHFNPQIRDIARRLLDLYPHDLTGEPPGTRAAWAALQ